MKIESVNNERVKDWMKLSNKKYRDLTGTFLVEGDHLVNEALKQEMILEIIATDDSFFVSDIPCYLVSENVMKKLSNQISPSKVMAVVKKFSAKDIQGNVSLLDNIQDPGNLGAIIRSAVAFNIDTIIMSEDTVDLYNEKVIRASEGMIFNLNFVKGNLKDNILELKNKGYQILGTCVKSGKDLKDIVNNKNVGIIIGNEGNGMNKELLEYCDELINIKISSKCESLNAGIAASIIFYELDR